MTRAGELLSMSEAVTIMKPVAVEDDLEKKFMDWQNFKRQYSVLVLVADKIATRISEIEKDLKDVTKGAANQQVTIDDAIVSYKTRGNTSVSYAKVYAKALEIATADQKAVLEAFKATVTSNSVTESLKIVDPKLEEFLLGLKSVTVDVLLTKLQDIKEIPDKAPDFVVNAQSESVVSAIKDIWKKVKASWNTVLSKLHTALSKGQKSANELKRLVAQPA